MPERKTVFISSTNNDLVEYRARVRDQVLALGMFPLEMEEFGAKDGNALQICYDAVQDTDIFVGIYAHRYGYAPDQKSKYDTIDGEERRGDGKTSITHWEYEWARERGIPILLFMLSDTDATGKPIEWRLEYIEPDPARQHLHNFKALLKNQHVVDFFYSPDNLAAKIATALASYAYQGQDTNWQKPKAPKPNMFFAGRQDDISQLQDLLATHHYALIQGMGGTGKTSLAKQLGALWAENYPAGVLWAELGPTADTVPLQVWADWKQTTPQGRNTDIDDVTPLTIRQWLAQASGQLLVIIDDVWHPTPLRTLLECLPDHCDIVITSRQTRFAAGIGDKRFRVYELQHLVADDAVTFLMQRLSATEDLRPSLAHIAELLGYHALALDMAATVIDTKQSTLKQIEKFSKRLEKYQGSDNPFKNLQLGDVRDDNLEAALALSYEPLAEHLQTAFRLLGVVPSGLSVSIDIAYALWANNINDCDDTDDAEDILEELADNGLATLREDGLYSQHQNLQAYARALLLRDNPTHPAQTHYDDFLLDFLRDAATATSKSQMRQAVAPYLAHIQQYGNRLVTGLDAWLIEHQAGDLRDYAQPEEKSIALDDIVTSYLQSTLALMQAGARRYIFDLNLGAEGEKWLWAGVWATRQLGTPLQQYELIRRLNSWYNRHGQRTQEYDYLQTLNQLAELMQNAELIASSNSALAGWHIRQGNYIENQRLNEGIVATLKSHLETLETTSTEDPLRDTDLYNSQTRARVLRNIGQTHFRLKQHEDALTYYDLALQQERKDGNLAGEAAVLQQQALCLRIIRQHSDAQEAIQQALDIQRTLGDKEHIASTLIQFGIQYRSEKKYNQALNAYHEVLNLRRNSDDNDQIASTYRNMAYIYKEMRRFDDAKDAYEQALTRYDADGNTLQVMFTLRNLAALLVTMQDIPNALPYFERTIAYFQQVGDEMQVASTQRALAAAYADARRIHDAIATYEEAFITYEKADNPVQMGYTLRTIGDIHTRRKKPKDAIPYYERAHGCFARAGDWNNIGFTCRKLSETSIRLNQQKDVEKYAYEAIDAYLKGGEENRAGQVWHDLAEFTRTVRKQPQQAIPHYVEALRLRNAIDPHGSALSYERLGDTYYELHDEAKAIAQYKQAFRTYLEEGSVRSANYVLRNLRKILKRQNNADELLALLQTMLTNGAYDAEVERILRQYLADEYNRQGQRQSARDIYVNLLDEAPLDARNNSGKKEMASLHAGLLLKNIHDIDQKQKTPDATYPLYERIIDKYREQNDTIAQARIWHWLGRIQADDGANLEAITSWQNALTLLLASQADHSGGDKESKSIKERGFNAYAIRTDLQRLLREQNDFAALWTMYEGQLAQETGHSKIAARIRTLKEMGDLALEMQKPSQAIAVLKEAIDLYATHQPPFMRFPIRHLQAKLVGAYRDSGHENEAEALQTIMDASS